MQIIHITPNNEGYEIVTLIANRVNRNNHFAVIQKDDQTFYTGGLLFNDTPTLRELLNQFPKERQYDVALSLKQNPFVKPYLEEN